jgi:hypothetical protein
MMKNPKKRHLKKALKELTKRTAATVQLLPTNHFKTASRLGMLPTLTSTTPLTSQEAYDVLYAGYDAEFNSTMGKTLPLGEGHFGVNPPSTPEERAERFRRSMPEGYNKQEDARGHEAALRRPNPIEGETQVLPEGAVLTTEYGTRPNPLREHWEKYGDQSDLRPVPDVNVDALLDKSANPELMQRIVERMSQDILPLGLSDPGRAKDRDFTKLAVKATPEQVAEMGKDMKLIFKDGKVVDPEEDK